MQEQMSNVSRKRIIKKNEKKMLNVKSRITEMINVLGRQIAYRQKKSMALKTEQQELYKLKCKAKKQNKNTQREQISSEL